MGRERKFSRRNLLAATGAAITTGLAGCGGNEEDTDNHSTDTDDSRDDISDTGEAEFDISVNLPEQPVIGDPNAAITVENTGNETGTYEGDYSIENGETLHKDIITEELEPGKQKEIGLSKVLKELQPGEHRLEIDDETYDFNLLLNWGWEDVLQSEYQWAVNRSDDKIFPNSDKTKWGYFDTEEFRDAVRNEEFPERLETTHPIIVDGIENLADEYGGASSAYSLTINPITKRIYIEEEEKSRPSEGYSAGHGYNYKDNINDSLWLTDSNAPFKGPVEERPLQERGSRSGAHDIIGSKFVDDSGNLIVTPEDLDFRGTAVYSHLPTKGLRVEDDLTNENTPSLAIDPDVARSYNEDILEGDDSELYWNKARPALLALKYASKQGMLEESENFHLILPIEDLPEFEGPLIGNYDEEKGVYVDESLDRGEFTDYVMELTEHLEFFETEDEYFDMLRSKAGQY